VSEEDFKRLPGPPSRVRIGRQGGRRALLVDGVAQSIEVRGDEPTPGYWTAMLPDFAPRRALMLGYGGGTIAHMLLARAPGVRVVAIEKDPLVLAASQRHPHFRLGPEQVELVEGDAFRAVRELADRAEQFDYVAVDLYEGSTMVRASLARPFLHRLDELVTDDGLIAFNLPRDRRTARRLRRVEQYFEIVRESLIGLNCVVHCVPVP
jgi:spermidine synthase